jgi:DNA-binding MarR family transcriptional regulator/N-acetylglutamate synthase-like GNAT family acetyltransferase
MTSSSPPGRVDAVRAFNRFYTRIIGVLDEGLLRTDYSLTEARVLYELAQADAIDVGALRDAVAIDAGYLSRILARFEAKGLLRRDASDEDARRRVVRLTPRGRSVSGTLDRRSADEVGALLSTLPDAEQGRLLGAMGTIRTALREDPSRRAVTLREPGPGELGWIVERHGAVYEREYGWDVRFEALVARIVADFAEHRDPRHDRAWIAEVDGVPIGSVLCVRRDDDVAQLRLLLVEPSARGLGVGTSLVEAVLRFARDAGYSRLTLWTQDALRDARRIYTRAGFALADTEPHADFGPKMVGQTWTLSLDGGPANQGG